MNLKKAGVHSACVICGEGNPLGLKLKFKLEEDGSASACFHEGTRFQGYDGILHGGVISAILDAAMTNCLFLHGVEALTGKLEVRFLKSIPCDQEIEILANIAHRRPPLYKLKARIALGGSTFATGEASFIEISRGRV